MTRRRKDPFAGKENVRHFRLVQRPLGEENEGNGMKMLNFDEMFEEYTKRASSFDQEYEVEEGIEEDITDTHDLDNYDFANDEDGELVDIDAELDRFAEEFIDIEGEDGVDRIKRSAVAVAGEAAKYGILLDDRDYDYTRHLRQVGVTPGAVFIQAPGQKKTGGSSAVNEKSRDFFDEPQNDLITTEASNITNSQSEIDPALIKANHEAARQQYRALLQQVGDDPVLREVIEALEDDRYVTEEIDDELVISLDNLNIQEEKDDFFDEDVDILNENEEFPDFIPSEALKRQIYKLEQAEQNYNEDFEQEKDEFDDVLNEYNDEEESEGDFSKIPYRTVNIDDNSFVDIEGEDASIVMDEEAEEIYKYLKEHGRARGTTLYDKKRRPDHLPPIHIAIAQYNELRKELAVNNDLIIKKYSEEDEEEARRQMKESERIIEGMVKIIDDPEEMEKRLNIETAKYLLKLSNSVQSGPKKIVETGVIKDKRETETKVDDLSDLSDSDSDNEVPRVNKGVARSSNETAEEKKARKAKIKAEKREKRAIKSEKAADKKVNRK